MAITVIKIDDTDFEELQKIFYRKTQQLADLSDVGYTVVYDFLNRGTDPHQKNKLKIIAGMVKYFQQEKESITHREELITRLSAIAA